MMPLEKGPGGTIPAKVSPLTGDAERGNDGMSDKKQRDIETPPPDLLRATGPEEARAIQDLLRSRCRTGRTIDLPGIRLVAGADAAYTQDRVTAAMVVMTCPGLEVEETTVSQQAALFPYIPGLLAFREGPAIAAAWASLATRPDLLLVNGHGYAHPRRFGIASHIGFVLDVPTIGVAQRLMTGSAGMPGEGRGSAAPVTDGDEVIGMVVRTVTGVKPVFVSAGHRTDLSLALDIVLRTTGSHRITEPIWQADALARKYRAGRI